MVGSYNELFFVSASRLRDASPCKPVGAKSPTRSVTASSPHRSVASPSPSSTVRAPSPAAARAGYLSNAVPKPYVSPARNNAAESMSTLAMIGDICLHYPFVLESEAPRNASKARPSEMFEPTKKPVSDRMSAWKQRTHGAAPPM